ncbi:MAG: ATP-grasp domain-containing protein [Phyllobacterium sp.]
MRFVSENRAALTTAFEVMLPAWETLCWLCDKPLLYRRADELGVRIPKTHQISSVAEAETLDAAFPVILKPNMGGGDGPFVKAKVVRADDHAGLARAYLAAADEVGGENIVVQEYVPGGGESQFSYAALWLNGQPVAEFAARRARQYPVEFGYTSTFVEVVDEPRVIETARVILESVNYSGLAEVEFKQDHRDGSLKLLDVNPRPWTWFGLGAAAGVDLGTMMWRVARGQPVRPVAARLGVSWMYLVRDIVAAATLIARGRIGVTDYLRSFGRVRSWATFAWNDPLPGVIDLPLTAWRVLTRRVLRRS